MGDWQKTKISQFLFERTGKYQPGDKTIAELKRIDKIDFSGNFHISQKSSNTKMILIKPGDFVISGIGVHNGSMGVYEGENDVTATIHYSSYTIDAEKISIEYFKRFLKSTEFLRLINDQVRGGMRPEIKAKHLLPLRIDLPDIEQQEKFVSYFRSIETEHGELKKETARRQALVKKIRQQILREAIEGKLTAKWREQNPNVEPANELLKRIQVEKERLIKDKKIKKHKLLPPISEDEKPFKLPERWEWCWLGELTFGFQYGTSSKSLKIGTTPVLRMGNVQSGEICWDGLVYSNDDKEIEKFSLIKGDLLFNRTNSRELVGKTGLYKGERMSIYAGYLIRFHMAENISPEFSNFVMNSTLHNKWCNEVKTDAIGQSNINATKLSHFRFPLPPFSEQRTIATKVEELLDLCNQLEDQITTNQVNTEQLMHAALKETFSRHSDTTSQKPVKSLSLL